MFGYIRHIIPLPEYAGAAYSGKRSCRWAGQYDNAIRDPDWPAAWSGNPSSTEAERPIAQGGLFRTIRVCDNPGMGNPRNRRDSGEPRNVARSVAFAIRVGPCLIRKARLTVSSVRGDRQRFPDGTYDAGRLQQHLP